MEQSPFMENTTPVPTPVVTKEPEKKKNYVPYIIAAVIVAFVIYVFYYSYSCFQLNQAPPLEPFIEKTIKTGTETDKSFDIDTEVRRLSDLQEKYLRDLNKARRG